MLTSDPRTRLRFLQSWGEHGDRPALIADGESLSYGELAERVAAESEMLGDPRRLVLIELSNTVAAIVSYLAALSAGHVVLIASDARSLDSLIQTYDPDVVAGFGNAPHVMERHRGNRHELHPDLALLLSTSGSTGSPKLVRLSYENLDSNAESIADYLGISTTERALTSLPLSYCYGLSVLHSHLTRGAAVVVTELSVVDPGFWNLARAARVTSFAGVPYTFELLDRAGFANLELPTLRYVTQAGGKLGEDRVRQFAELGRRMGWNFVVMYGQTEATARMAYLPAERAFDAPQAIGVPIPGGEFSIDDDGELTYRGPNVMLGYAQTPSDLALGRTVESLCTGDLARRRPDGLYEIVGRRSRFLKLFGLRIDLDQVEYGLRMDGVNALCTGDDTALVVAVTDTAGDPAATVCAKTGLPASAVRTIVLDELPRTINGKADYERVLELTRAQRTKSSVHSDGVRTIYREMLKVDQVDDSDSFVSLGGESLSFVETSERLERLLGPLPANWHLTPVEDLQANAIDRRRGFITWMETSVVLRAAAIVLVCSNHVGLSHFWGAAHVLLAAAGYSFARFQVSALATRTQVRPLFRSIARIAVPSVCVIAIAYVMTREYEVWNILLVEHFFAPAGPNLGAGGWDPVWNYWFIEVLVLTLLLYAVVLSIPAARRLEQSQPFGFAVAVLGISLTMRFHALVNEAPMEPYRLPGTMWLVALGWAAMRVTRTAQRVLLTIASACGALLPGFFDDEPARKWVILGGLLLLVWVARLPVLAVLRRPTAILASASLWIYLTQPLTFWGMNWVQSRLNNTSAATTSTPGVEQETMVHDLRLAVAAAIALAVGILAWKAYQLTALRWHQFRRVRPPSDASS